MVFQQTAKAFSSEVEPVRVKKTRQNKESRAPFRFNRNGKGSRAEGLLQSPGASRRGREGVFPRRLPGERRDNS